MKAMFVAFAVATMSMAFITESMAAEVSAHAEASAEASVLPTPETQTPQPGHQYDAQNESPCRECFVELTDEEKVRSKKASEECYAKHNYTSNVKEFACFFRCGREFSGTFVDGKPNITLEEENFEKSLRKDAREKHGELVDKLKGVNAYCFKAQGFEKHADDVRCDRFMAYNMCVDFYSAKGCGMAGIFDNYNPDSEKIYTALPESDATTTGASDTTTTVAPTTTTA